VTDSKEERPETQRLPRPADGDLYTSSIAVFPPEGRTPIYGVVNCSYVWGAKLPRRERFCRYSKSFVGGLHKKILNSLWQDE